jgi:hypothetical protein
MEEDETAWQVPKSIEWYLDGTKWLVSISSGILVFGFGFFGNADSILQETVLFGISAAIFGFSCLSGIATFFWLTSYINAKENYYRELAVLSPDEVIERDKKIEKLEKSMNNWYYSLLISFVVGLIVFSTFGITKLFNGISGDKATNSSFTITPISVTEQKAFLLEEKSGGLWIIEVDSLMKVKSFELDIQKLKILKNK